MHGNYRRRGLLLGAATLLLGSVGCESMSKTAQGGLVGGGVGAGLGAAVGSASGNAGKGALIGGLAGTVMGGLVGNDMDQQDKKTKDIQLANAQAAAARPTLSVADVQRMAAGGSSDDIIINQIRTTGSTYNLTVDDIQFLTSNGVSSRVITEMQNSRSRPVAVAPPPQVVRERVYVREQPEVVYVRPAPVYYVPPPPPPPPAVGFGVSYTRVR